MTFSNSISLFNRFLTLLALATVAGCTFASDAPEEFVVNDVREYYYQLEDTTHYTYERSFADGTDDYVGMEMKGEMISQTYDGLQKYRCVWDYSYGGQQGARYDYYFALGAERALYLRYYANPKTAWVDLEAPLKTGASWNFVFDADSVLAEVTKTRAMATVGGVTYNDIIEVAYSGNASKTIKWFARDLGMVYSLSTDLKGDLVEEWKLQPE